MSEDSGYSNQSDHHHSFPRMSSVSPFKAGASYDSSVYENKIPQPLQIPLVQLQPIRTNMQSSMMHQQAGVYDSNSVHSIMSPSNYGQPRGSLQAQQQQQQQQQQQTARDGMNQVPGVGGMKGVNVPMPISQQGMYQIVGDVPHMHYRSQGDSMGTQQQQQQQQQQMIVDNMASRSGISNNMPNSRQFYPMKSMNASQNYPTQQQQPHVISPQQKPSVYYPNYPVSSGGAEFASPKSGGMYVGGMAQQQAVAGVVPKSGSSSEFPPKSSNWSSGQRDDAGTSEMSRSPDQSLFGGQKFLPENYSSSSSEVAGDFNRIADDSYSKQYQNDAGQAKIVINNEEFPTLMSSMKGSKQKDPQHRGTASMRRRSAENVHSSRQESKGKEATDRADESSLEGKGNLASREYGVLGLLDIIRMTNEDLNMLSLGVDLTSLGLNLNSPDNLHSSFESPWMSKNKQDIKFSLPQVYKIPHSLPPVSSRVESFTEETLFYIFAHVHTDDMDTMAAAELAKRSWRYNKRLATWMKYLSEDTVLVFNMNTWEKVKKSVKDIPRS